MAAYREAKRLNDSILGKGIEREFDYLFMYSEVPPVFRKYGVSLNLSRSSILFLFVF